MKPQKFLLLSCYVLVIAGFICLKAVEPVKTMLSSEAFGARSPFQAKSRAPEVFEPGEEGTGEEGGSVIGISTKVPPEITEPGQEAGETGETGKETTIPVSTGEPSGSTVTLPKQTTETGEQPVTTQAGDDITKVEQNITAIIKAPSDVPLEEKAAQLANLVNRVSFVFGPSELNLSTQDRITVLSTMLDALGELQKQADAQAAQQQAQVSSEAVPQTAQQGGFTWWFNQAANVVKTAAALVNTAASTIYNVALGSPTAVERTRQQAQAALADTIKNAVAELPLPATEAELQSQQDLLNEYSKLSQKYGTSVYTDYEVNARRSMLPDLFKTGFSLTNIVPQLEAQYDKIKSDKVTPLAQKAAQLDVLNRTLASTSQLVAKTSGVSSPLVSEVQSLTASLPQDVDTTIKSVQDRLAELNKISSTMSDATLDAALIEAAALEKALSFKTFSDRLATTDPNANTQTLASTVVANLTLAQQRNTLERDITSQLQPLTGDKAKMNYQTKAAYKQRIAKLYEVVTNPAFYPPENYSKQLELLTKLQKTINASSALSADYMRDITTQITQRSNDIKNLQENPRNAISQLDETLGLYKRVTDDQTSAIDDYIDKQLDFQDVESIQELSQDTRNQLSLLLEAYKLNLFDEKGASINALLATPDLSSGEQLALKLESDTARPEDLVGVSGDELASQLSEAYPSLFSRAVKAIKQSIGAKYIAIGQWLLTLGANLRWGDAANAIESMVNKAAPITAMLENNLTKDMVASFPELAGIVQTASSLHGAVEKGASAIGSAKGAISKLDWLGLKLQQLGEEYLNKGITISGQTAIDIDALFERAEKAKVESAKASGILGEGVRNLVGRALTMVASTVNSALGTVSENDVSVLKTNYDKAQADLRQFLGLPDSASPEEFKQAYRNMMLLVNARGYSDRDPDQVKLVKSQLATLTGNLVKAGADLSKTYSSLITYKPALIATLVQEDEIGSPVEFQITPTAVAAISTPEEAAKAATNIAVANATLKNGIVDEQKAQIELGKFNKAIVTAAMANPFSASTVQDFSDALVTLLTNKQATIQTQLAEDKAQIASDVQAFEKTASKA